MDAYFPSKLKRKDLEHVNDDFSEFSLSSPARKIRRLDAELPPIIEEEECEIPSMVDHSVFPEQGFDCNSSGEIKIEELPAEPSNEERAIVLFKTVEDTPLSHSPSNFSLSLSPQLISGLKNQLIRSHHSNSWRFADCEAVENNSSVSGNACLAVVPWVPSHNYPAPASASASVDELPHQTKNSEMMEDEDGEEMEMEVEDGTDIEQRNANGSGMILSEGFTQWPQQHCLIPQPPQNSSAPIVWYR